MLTGHGCNEAASKRSPWSRRCHQHHVPFDIAFGCAIEHIEPAATIDQRLRAAATAGPRRTLEGRLFSMNVAPSSRERAIQSRRPASPGAASVLVRARRRKRSPPCRHRSSRRRRGRTSAASRSAGARTRSVRSFSRVYSIGLPLIGLRAPLPASRSSRRGRGHCGPAEFAAADCADRD